MVLAFTVPRLVGVLGFYCMVGIDGVLPPPCYLASLRGLGESAAACRTTEEELLDGWDALTIEHWVLVSEAL